MSISFPGGSSIDATLSRHGASRLVSMKQQLAQLQAQISTGKIADNYADLGAGRARSLDVRQKLSTIDAYSASITDTTIRTKALELTLTRMEKIGTDMAASLTPSAYELDSNGQTLQQKIAKGNLQEVIDLLNQDSAGRALFAGRSADKSAVTVDADAMISGVRSAIALRKANDAGAPANLGRLTLTAAGSTATIAPPAAAVPPAVTYGLGMPATQTFDFTTTPSDGQTFQVNLTMPDGASKTLTLVARTTVPSPGAPADELSFAIGATPAATATSFVGAATSALTALTSSSEFSAASSVAGAKDYVANTANWYGGDTSATPRASASSRIDDDQTVGIGMEASEPAFQNLLAQLGVLAAESFSTATATDKDRYAALTSRVSDQIKRPVTPTSPAPGKAYTIQSAHVDIGLAAVTLKNAQQRQTDTKAQLENVLSGVEDANPEAVAAQLMTLQTQLQASYQMTSTMAKMSLVNYLG
ncbi:hypothetical protein ABEG18_16310 [Alsobacter sp. KACC 23698]|uniref:Flagellin n=1 Tax=Alsobacter sp. KACC 23698 TaxID=3149229 RepID=A0AAU7JAH9_9HYPH